MRLGVKGLDVLSRTLFGVVRVLRMFLIYFITCVLSFVVRTVLYVGYRQKGVKFRGISGKIKFLFPAPFRMEALPLLCHVSDYES